MLVSLLGFFDGNVRDWQDTVGIVQKWQKQQKNKYVNSDGNDEEGRLLIGWKMMFFLSYSLNIISRSGWKIERVSDNQWTVTTSSEEIGGTREWDFVLDCSGLKANKASGTHLAA